jgi:hypothetical protein
MKCGEAANAGADAALSKHSGEGRKVECVGSDSSKVVVGYCI